MPAPTDRVKPGEATPTRQLRTQNSETRMQKCRHSGAGRVTCDRGGQSEIHSASARPSRMAEVCAAADSRPRLVIARPRRLPTSFGGGVESDGQSESGRTSPVSYMSSSDMGPKSLKFMTHHSLLITRESPLSHPPGYSVRNCVNPPASNQAGHSARNSVMNPASYLSGYPASHWEGDSPENPASYSDGCGDHSSSGRSGNRPDSR